MRILFFLPLLLMMLTTKPAHPQVFPAEMLRVEVLLKLLSLNQGLDISSIDSVTIVLIYDGGDSTARRQAESYRRWFSDFPKPPFRGKPLRILSISNRALADISWTTIQAVVVLPGKENRVDAIQEKCADFKVLSMTTDSTLVSRGIASGVTLNSSREPEIWFNVESLEAEGAIYRVEILQLAKQIIWE